MNLSTLSKLSPRTILLGLAGAAMFGVFALVVAVIVIWRSTEWDSGSLAKVADATAALVSRSGEHATRALEGTQGTMAVAEAARAVAVTAAPALLDRVDAMALNSSAGPDPQPWPKGLALRQTQYRQAGAVTEYAYVALAPGFDLGQLRQQLIALGYVEQVLAQNRSALEAVYRGERQLFLTATLRDGRQHINIRDLPIAGEEQPGP